MEKLNPSRGGQNILDTNKLIINDDTQPSLIKIENVSQKKKTTKRNINNFFLKNARRAKLKI